MTSKFSAGTARTEITPPYGIAHASWGAQTHERAQGVDMPLYATALAISDGSSTAIFIDIDVVFMWEDDIVKQTRRSVSELTGLPHSNIRISYTHTHSGPVMNRDSWIEEGSEMVDPYLQELSDDMIGVAWKAFNDLSPARINAGSGESTIAVNRRFRRPEDGEVIVGRNWDGPVDHEVKVVRIDTENGDPLAAIANYACHPITVGPDNDQITPDYPGVVKQVVERSTGATCLFLQGATGDIGPIHGVSQNGIEEYKPLGRRLGSEVNRVYWEIESVDRKENYVETLPSGAPLAVYDYEYDKPDHSITILTRTIELPIKDLPTPDELDQQYQTEMAKLNEMRESDVEESEVQNQAMRCRRLELRKGVSRSYGGMEHANFEVQAVSIGSEIAFLGMPGEPFVEIGKEVKESSPFNQTIFSGYTNDGWGYIPTAEEYPHGGYEVDISPFTPDAAQIVVDDCIEILNEAYPN